MARRSVPKPTPTPDKHHEDTDRNVRLYVMLIGATTAVLIAVILSSDTLFAKERKNALEDINPKPLHAPPTPQWTSNVKTHTQEASGPSCYTLEEYSVEFIAPAETEKLHKNNVTQYFYRCGTRLIDLSTETNQSKVRLCKTERKKRRGLTLASKSMFSTLRVYLEDDYEVKLHLKQQHNVASQRILLERLNDDYCDCIDGTDELLTSACSMSGGVSPISRERWKRYLIANAHVQLYREEEAPSERRTARLLRRLGGPVLPFICRGDSNVWLAPSRVADGVVDCCDGSDEKGVGAQERWKSHVLALQPRLHRDSGEVFMLYPTTAGKRTVSGMLLDKDLTSLMSCRRVKEERLRDARLLVAIVEKGHTTYKQRKGEGWERYGKELLLMYTKLKKKLRDMSGELDKRQKAVLHLMEMRHAHDPISAGVSRDEVRSIQRLYAEFHEENLRLRHTQVILLFRWLGDDFEFYPLATVMYEIPSERVVHTAQSSAVGVQEQREAYHYNATYVLDALPQHVDNVTYETFAFYPYLYIVGMIKLTAEQRAILQQRATKHHGGPNSNTSEVDSNDTRKAPASFGFWQPDHTEVSLQHFAAMDSAGGVLLRRRLYINEGIVIMGGTPQCLLHEEYTFTGRRRRVLRLASDETPKSTREEVENAAHGGKDMNVEVPQQYNTPDVAAVQVFLGGLSCGLESVNEAQGSRSGGDGAASDRDGSKSPPNSQAHNRSTSITRDSSADASTEENSGDDMTTTLQSRGGVVYACADVDGILEWYRNGNCQHEIVFGTPSACPEWVLKKARERVWHAEEALRQEDKPTAI